MWKCKECRNVLSETDGSIHASSGYCPKCKKYYVLERYDPLNEETESPL